MKKFLLLFLILSALVVNAQTLSKVLIDNSGKVVQQTPQPVDPRIAFPDFEKSTREYLAAHPDAKPINKLGKPEWTFTVGSTHSWYTYNYKTSGYDYLASTCRKVGTYCYIFVDDTYWTNGKVTQASVDSVELAFDSKTPANASKGIYQTDTGVFGNPPNVDGDAKIIIFITDIQDNYSTSNSSYIGGFFDSGNEYNIANSNVAEIFYLDCYPQDLTTSSGVQKGMQTCAHEFQHMIEFNYHNSTAQTTFFNEGCSLVAERINGYPFREQNSYSGESNIYLLNWRQATDQNVLKDYSRAARFMLYMYEQFGSEFLGKFVQSSSTGITAVDDALSKLTTTTTRRFADILPDWFQANIVGNTSINAKYGYTLSGLTLMQTLDYWTPGHDSTQNIYGYGVKYVRFTNTNGLSIKFYTSSSNIVIKAYKKGLGTAPIDVATNTTVNFSDLGSTYNDLIFIIYNTSSTNATVSVEYKSSGTIKQTTLESYNFVNSAAYLINNTTYDTVAVHFAGYSNAKLDSVKIQFYNSGTSKVGVWVYTGGSPSIFGTKLLTPITINPTVSNPGTDWTKVNLTSYNISAVNPFAIGVVCTGATAQMLLSQTTGATTYYSNVHQASNSTWYVFGSSTYSDEFMIKAYIHFTNNAVGVEKTMELLPASYSLEQNYPNPFNPSTYIKFSLPEASRITIKIYDVLGREVRTLFEGEQAAGTHILSWDGKDAAGRKVTSGVYVYTLLTDKALISKKMVLLK